LRMTWGLPSPSGAAFRALKRGLSHVTCSCVRALKVLGRFRVMRRRLAWLEETRREGGGGGRDAKIEDIASRGKSRHGTSGGVKSVPLL